MTRDRIEAGLRRLGAELEPPTGWERRVLAADRRRRLLWLLYYAACVGALVAALAYRAYRAHQPRPLTLDVVIEPGPTVWRGP